MRSGFLKALILLALAVILLGMPLLLTGHRIRPATFERIQAGMSEVEVEELLGVKPGNYDGYSLPPRPNLLGGQSPKVWCSRHGAVAVWFSDQGRVWARLAESSEPATWWARLGHRYFPPLPDRHYPLSDGW